MTSKRKSVLREFIENEQTSGVILILCTILSLLIANSAWGEKYIHAWHRILGITLGDFTISMSLLHWINDGLMAVFFLLIGLEVKRELFEGELSTAKKAMLPVLAAAGGMLVPALIYLSFNFNSDYKNGWGIPVATDIAFALGILSLAGKHIPASLKVFLTALAVIDDMGAILVIALFYTEQLSSMNLFYASGIVIFLFALNRLKVRLWIVYVFPGIVLWYFILQSGIHSTVAGVLLAFTIPLKKADGEKSLLEKLEHSLFTPVKFLIMPLFALANTALAISIDNFGSAPFTIFTGIFLGLFLGKPAGIFLFTFLFSKLRLIALPANAATRNIIGIGFLGGVGFTMSIFISFLAFGSSEAQSISKIAILCASMVSGTVGYLLLRGR